MKTIYFATAVQATLFTVELSGQISDGLWENSTPRGHWKDPCNAEVKVDAANPRIEGFYPKRAYGFASPTLLECVGDRMLMFARARIKYPELSNKAIGYLDSGDWMWKETGTHYESIRTDLAVIGIHNYADQTRVVDELVDVKYDMKDLKRDLKAISQVFKAARG